MQDHALFILIFFFTLCSYASKETPDIHLELGEFQRLTQNFSKIWIEDQQLIKAQNTHNQILIKSLKTGVTHIRLDNELKKVIISPIGSKKTFHDWSRLQMKFVGLNIEYCGPRLCLNGHLYRVSDYLRIIQLMQEFDSRLLLSLKVDPALEVELRKTIENQFRHRGLTPLKVLFGEPWRVYTAKERFRTEHELEISNLGINLEFLQNSTEISDNIKVAVKVAEISKNFERKLGLRWPDSYQAQIVNSQLTSEGTFELAINAAEKAGEAKVLASPNLICRSGKVADFFAGGEFPIKVLGLRTKEIQWKRYGIGLKFKPIIDPLGQMSLQIETEVSTLDRSISVDDVPALHTNRVSSFFDLISSRTIAISGLIKNEVSENTEGIPFLKNIPVLGALFRSQNFQENKSELIIFVTPELMQ